MVYWIVVTRVVVIVQGTPCARATTHIIVCLIVTAASIIWYSCGIVPSSLGGLDELSTMKRIMTCEKIEEWGNLEFFTFACFTFRSHVFSTKDLWLSMNPGASPSFIMIFVLLWPNYDCSSCLCSGNVNNHYLDNPSLPGPSLSWDPKNSTNTKKSLDGPQKNQLTNNIRTAHIWSGF